MQRLADDRRSRTLSNRSLNPDIEERSGTWILILAAPVIYVIALALLLPATPLPAHEAYDMFKRQLDNGLVQWVSTANTGQFIEVGLNNHQEVVARRPAFEDPDLEHALEIGKVQINPIQHSSLAWDIVVSATTFATLSAILAGFVFIGIIGILTLPPHGEDQPRPPLAVLNEEIRLPLLALVQAFLTLVDAAFLFSILAGESSGAGRVGPIFEGFSPSWLLALGVVQMAVAIAWILDRYELDWPVVRTSNWIAYFAVALALVSTAGVLVTPIYNVPSVSGGEAGLLWAVAAAPVLACLALGWRWNYRSSASPYQLTLPMIIAVGFVTATYVTLTALAGENEFVKNFRIFFLVAVASQVALAGLSALYLASLPGRRPEPKEHAHVSATTHQKRSRRND